MVTTVKRPRSFTDILVDAAGPAYQNYQKQQAAMQQKEQFGKFLAESGIDPNASPEEIKFKLAELANRRSSLREKVTGSQLKAPSITEWLTGGKQDPTQNPYVQQEASALGIDLSPQSFKGQQTNNLIQTIIDNPNLSDNEKSQLVEEMSGPQDQSLSSVFNQANISNQDRSRLASEQAQSQNFPGILGTLRDAPGIIGSGLGQALGTLGGIGPLLNMLSPSSLKEANTPEFQAAKIDRWKQQLQEMDPNSQQYRNLAEEIAIGEADLKRTRQRGTAGFPSAIDIKEEYIRPTAEKVGARIDPQNWFESAEEIGGSMIPYFLNTLGAGTKASTNLGSFLAKTWGPAVAGQLTKKITGSELLGEGIQGMGYLVASLNPGAFQKSASEGFNAMDKAIESAAVKKVNVSPSVGKSFDKVATRLHNGIEGIPGTGLIKKSLESLDKSFVKGGKASIDVIKQIHKDLGLIYPKLAANGLKEEAGLLRKITTDLITDWGKKNSPTVLKDWQQANSVWKTLSNTNLLNEGLNESVKSGGLAASVQGIIRKFLAELGGKYVLKGSKHINAMLSNPKLVKIFGQSLNAAAKDNPARTAQLLTRFGLALEKEMKSKEKN